LCDNYFCYVFIFNTQVGQQVRSTSLVVQLVRQLSQPRLATSWQLVANQLAKWNLALKPSDAVLEVRPWPRGTSRPHFYGLGLKGPGLLAACEIQNPFTQSKHVLINSVNRLYLTVSTSTHSYSMLPTQ